tara:strand:+ start:533 stop:931 length:399 start_codon:yes stop_codon:yes gene_type:complete
MLNGLNHITIAVSDIEKSLTFYTEVLGFTGHVAWDFGAYLSINGVWLCLSLDTPAPSTDYSHIAWSIEKSDFPLLYEKVISSGAKQWKTNKSEGDSLYFLDPDGHKLEIHVGGLAQRLASLKNKPYKGLRWL